MYARILSAAVVALPVTGVLLYAMSTVFRAGDHITQLNEPSTVALVFTEPEPAVEKTRIRRPQRPPVPAIRPGAATIESEKTEISLALNVIEPKLLPGPNAPSGFAVIGDMNFLPVRVEPPEYPSAAVSRGLEGAVVLEFTVTESGTVADIEVIESAAPTLDAAAIKATLRYTFKPRIVGGVAIETKNVTNRIVFVLKDHQRQFTASL